MSQYLKYLKEYKEERDEVLFYLKDLPSSKISGDKIVKELYIFLFHDETLQLNRVHKVDDLLYKVEKEQKYFCLNCPYPIFFEEDSNYITTCTNCNWRNELGDTPAITPIIIKTKTFEDFSSQIAYPLLDESLLKYLPKKLKTAVEAFLKEHIDFTKEMYQNIFHNIYKKDIGKISLRIRELEARKKFTEFFQNTNFI